MLSPDEIAQRNNENIIIALCDVLAPYHRLHGLHLVAGRLPNRPEFYSFIVPDRDHVRQPISPGRVWDGAPWVDQWGALAVRRLDTLDQLVTHEAVPVIQLADWYERHLALAAELDPERSDAWRRQTSVNDVEAYIYTWRVMGLVANKLGARIHTNELHSSDIQSPHAGPHRLSRLWVRDPLVDLHFIHGHPFSTAGYTELESATFSFWHAHLSGRSTESIVDAIVADIIYWNELER